MAMASSGKVPFLGCKISLISRSEIRYEGILYTVDVKESTLALAKVVSFGTEDRPTDKPIPPRNEVYDYIIFRATDIKDVRVCEPPKNQSSGLDQDPAIVKHSDPNALHAPTSSRPPPPLSGQFNNRDRGFPPASMPWANAANAPLLDALSGLSHRSREGRQSQSRDQGTQHDRQRQQDQGQRRNRGSFRHRTTSQRSDKDRPRDQQRHDDDQPQRNRRSSQSQGQRGRGNSRGRGRGSRSRGNNRQGQSQNQDRDIDQVDYQQRNGMQQQRQGNRRMGYRGRGGNRGFQRGGMNRGNGRGGWGWAPWNYRGGWYGNRFQRQRSRSQNRGQQNRDEKFDEDYDFESAEEEFKKMVLEMKDGDATAAVAVNPASQGTEVEIVEGESEGLKIQISPSTEKKIYYDKSKFFDKISSESFGTDQSAKPERKDWRAERKLNSETFGQAAVRTSRGRGYFDARGGGGMYRPWFPFFGGYGRGRHGGTRYSHNTGIPQSRYHGPRREHGSSISHHQGAPGEQAESSEQAGIDATNNLASKLLDTAAKTVSAGLEKKNEPTHAILPGVQNVKDMIDASTSPLPQRPGVQNVKEMMNASTSPLPPRPPANTTGQSPQEPTKMGPTVLG